MKKLLLLFLTVFGLLFLLSFFYDAQAQINGTFKSVRYINADSTEVRSKALNGTIYYNQIDKKFRVYEDSTWKDLTFDPSGLEFWPLSGTGTLTGSVFIDGDGQQVDIVGSPLSIYGGSISGNDYIQLEIEKPSFPPGSGSEFIVRAVGNAVGTFEGIKYDNDYSSNYTNRSLIDLEYANDNYITLGTNQTLATNKQLSLNNQFFNFTGSNTGFIIDDNGNFVRVTGESIQFIGAGSFPGATYNMDYSANYTDRSLPDWGNVQQLISDSLSGFSPSGDFWPLDGNFSTTSGQNITIGGNTNFQMDGNEFEISDGAVGPRLFMEGFEDILEIGYPAGQGGYLSFTSPQTLTFEDMSTVNMADTVDFNFTSTGVFSIGVGGRLILPKFNGNLTDGAPTITEINAACGCTPSDFGNSEGQTFWLRDLNGTTNTYLIVNDAASGDWRYVEMTKAL